MMTLLGVELRRNFSRRVYKILLIVIGGAILTAALIVFFNHSQTERFVGGYSFGPEQSQLVEDCYARTNGSEDCARRYGTPVMEDDRLFLTSYTDILMGITPTLVILAWVLAASFIGAEWRANTIGPLLTWEPRRARLLIAKLLASIIVVATTAIGLHLVLGLALYPTVAFRGSTQGANAAFWRELAGVVLRSSLLATLASVIGFAVGSIGRNTTAAVGIGFGYLAILEGGVLGALLPWIRPWLLVGNAIILVSGERSFDVAGRTPIQAALILTCYAAGAAALAVTLFRRRDVT